MELIEREAAKAKKAYCEERHEYVVPVAELDWLPTIDATPVVHGRWAKHDGYTECSVCEYWYDSPETEDTGDRSNYCPNCGARMTGG